uniref:AAA+ ATPase domain-containing protein n=1 Tax=Magnetococcus massalia (strain MO-1) TaxID=451514 RepID=A0A1S7LJC6_MAGMO|nr:protein of unknown function, ATPase, AAA+ type [Candidatus Magnetococcus massalia]
MYEHHFQLRSNPFKNTPNPKIFFTGGRRQDILEALLYAVGKGDALLKVVGEVGAGKTMLCRMLLERLPRDVESVFLNNPSLSHTHVLHAIALDLKLPIQMEDSELVVLNALQQYFLKRHTDGFQIVIIIDEAQSMSIETLEKVRLLSNLETHTDKLVQLVLFGQPELDLRISEPGIRQLRERITHHFLLEPFNASETASYIDFRLRAMGYAGDGLFPGESMKLVHQISQGLSRRINIVVDKALMAAYAENEDHVTPAHIKQAVQDNAFRPLTVEQKEAASPSRLRHYWSISWPVMAAVVVGMGGATLIQQWLIQSAYQAAALQQQQPVLQQPVPPPTQRPQPQPPAVTQKVLPDPVPKPATATGVAPLPRTDPLTPQIAPVTAGEKPTASKLVHPEAFKQGIVAAKASLQQEAKPTTANGQEAKPVEVVVHPPQQLVKPKPQKVVHAKIVDKKRESRLNLDQEKSLVQSRRDALLKWVKVASPKHYTLRLLSVSTYQPRWYEKEIMGWNPAGKGIYIRTTLKNSPPYDIIYYGEFATIQEAKLSLARLPSRYSKYGAYAMPISQLQKHYR